MCQGRPEAVVQGADPGQDLLAPARAPVARPRRRKARALQKREHGRARTPRPSVVVSAFTRVHALLNLRYNQTVLVFHFPRRNRIALSSASTENAIVTAR